MPSPGARTLASPAGVQAVYNSPPQGSTSRSESARLLGMTLMASRSPFKEAGLPAPLSDLLQRLPSGLAGRVGEAGPGSVEVESGWDSVTAQRASTLSVGPCLFPGGC